jgi:hypothetical protein
MAYARHYTLLKIVRDVGLSWVQTNDYGKTGKEHLLQMRREGLVDYESGSSQRVTWGISRRTVGPEIIANWYTITFKGIQKLLDEFPNDEDVKTAARNCIMNPFKEENKYWQIEIKHRSPKTT